MEFQLAILVIGMEEILDISIMQHNIILNLMQTTADFEPIHHMDYRVQTQIIFGITKEVLFSQVPILMLSDLLNLEY